MFFVSLVVIVVFVVLTTFYVYCWVYAFRKPKEYIFKYEAGRKFLLPWSRQRYFYFYRQFKGCSLETVRRFYEEATPEQREQMMKMPLPAEFFKELFDGGVDEDLAYLVKADKLTFAQFSLLAKTKTKLLLENMPNRTLSVERLNVLLGVSRLVHLKDEEAFQQDTNTTLCASAVLNIVWRDGMPASLIRAYFCDRYVVDERLKRVVKARSQRELLSFIDDSIRRERMKATEAEEKLKLLFAENLEPEAQMFLQPYQYEIYHKAGKSLCETALCYYLAANGDMANLLVQYEPVADSQTALVLVKNNPRLYAAYLSEKTEKKGLPVNRYHVGQPV